MSRTLTAGMVTELTAASKRPVLFVSAEFLSGTVYYWTGIGTIAWNGQTWLGAGQLLRVAPAEETLTVRAAGARITLSGLSAAIVALAMDEARQGKFVQCWLGFLDSAGAVIADPTVLFRGWLDDIETLIGPEMGSVTIVAESRMASSPKAYRRFTETDQKAEYAADTFFDFVEAVQTWRGTWGSGPQRIPAARPIVDDSQPNDEGGGSWRGGGGGDDGGDDGGGDE